MCFLPPPSLSLVLFEFLTVAASLQGRERGGRTVGRRVGEGVWNPWVFFGFGMARVLMCKLFKKIYIVAYTAKYTQVLAWNGGEE